MQPTVEITLRKDGEPDLILNGSDLVGRALPDAIGVPIFAGPLEPTWREPHQEHRALIFRFSSIHYRLLKVTRANHLGPTAAIYAA